MPKIPIDFSYGHYEDAAPSVENRRVLNCYPETVPGENTRTIVRGIEGLNSPQFTYDGKYLGTITWESGRNIVFVNDGGVVKVYDGSVFLFDLTAMGDAGEIALATNNQTVVVVRVDSTDPADDYYIFRSGSIQADQIVNKDADYSSYGKARDVKFVNGYYLFNTVSALFHGSNITTGDALNFDPLAFSTVPADAEFAIGMEVSNASVYLFTRNRTYIYRVAPTTPFSFALNNSLSINISITARGNVTAYGDDIFLIGYENEPQNPSLYKLQGTSLLPIKEFRDKISLLELYRISCYQLNGHKMVSVYSPEATDTVNRTCYTYDDTESTLRGYPVLHIRSFVNSTNKDTLELGSYPVWDYFYTFISGTSNDVRAISYDAVNDQTNWHNVPENSSLNEASFFNAPATQTRVFEYSFPIIRRDSNPLSIKKISLGFNANVATAELLQSTDGITYTSLGEYDLTTVSSNTAEWRRLGRYEADAMFKVRTTTTSSSDPMVIIDGYFEV